MQAIGEPPSDPFQVRRSPIRLLIETEEKALMSKQVAEEKSSSEIELLLLEGRKILARRQRGLKLLLLGSLCFCRFLVQSLLIRAYFSGQSESGKVCVVIALVSM